MFKNLDLFATSFAMARYAGTRQAATARNMANADTPGYQARELPSFAEALSRSSFEAMRVTRPDHLRATDITETVSFRLNGSEASPNGNTVSIEQEMINAVEIEREHSRALAIYKHGLDVLRLSMGRR